MGDLSKNFSRAEFACHCGCGFGLGDGDVNPRLVARLQHVRDDIGQPVTVLSGCRCAAYNAKVGGAKNSQHLLGNAADIRVLGCTAQALYDYLDSKPSLRFNGMGLYGKKGFVHVDVRDGHARWTG